MHAFYIKNLKTGLYHAGASYGGRWTANMAQFFTRKKDAEYRVRDLTRRSYQPSKLADLKICEVDIPLE